VPPDVLTFFYIEFNMSAAAGQLGYMLATGASRPGKHASDAKKKTYSSSWKEAKGLLELSYQSHDSWGVLGMGYCFYKGSCEGIDRNITKYE
jgi:hypothetical protein